MDAGCSRTKRLSPDDHPRTNGPRNPITRHACSSSPGTRRSQAGQIALAKRNETGARTLRGVDSNLYRAPLGRNRVTRATNSAFRAWAYSGASPYRRSMTRRSSKRSSMTHSFLGETSRNEARWSA